MNDFQSSGFVNSGIFLNHLFQNKIPLVIYLDDGTKIAGTLLGWDSDYLIILEGKTVQMVQTKKWSRLQADLENLPAVEIPSQPEVSRKPEKFTPSFVEIKEPTVAAESNVSEPNKGPFKDKLDQLVGQW